MMYKITLYPTWMYTITLYIMYTTWDVHNTINNNLSTWKHAPILEQIDGTRFAENISQALMVMH